MLMVDAAKKCNLLTGAESALSILQRHITYPPAHSAYEELPAVDQNSFLKQFGLVPAQSSGLPKQLEVTECNVIVIDDDEDDDQIPSHHNRCRYTADLFGTTRPLRSDVDINRLRRLLTIDISSPLMRSSVLMSTLKSDGMSLNPMTVVHSVRGCDNKLDYNTFCRTPVKGMHCGRLRQRECRVRYRSVVAGTYCHYYCFTRSHRRRFCQRFDTGLSRRSYRLYQKYDRCSVVLEQLTAEEISDWRSSQRLRDYYTKMKEKEEKEKASALNSSRNAEVDEVINVSSDSEDEASSPVRKPQDRMFTCHQCNIKLPCGGRFRSLIREHYRAYHDIVDIDIVRIVHPNGSTTMQIIHAPQRSSVTETTPQHGSSLHSLQSRYPGSPAMQSPPRIWLCANGVRNPQPSEPSSASFSQLPLPRKPIALLSGSALCRGEAVSTQSLCDADVICLD